MGHDRVRRLRRLTLYAGRSPTAAIDRLARAAFDLFASLCQIVDCTAQFRSPAKPGPTPEPEPGEIGTDAARNTGNRGAGWLSLGHNRRCTAAGSRRSLCGGYPIPAQLGRLSRYVDPVQAGDVFTQYLLLDLQGQIHVVLLFQILRQSV